MECHQDFVDVAQLATSFWTASIHPNDTVGNKIWGCGSFPGTFMKRFYTLVKLTAKVPETRPAFPKGSRIVFQSPLFFQR